MRFGLVYTHRSNVVANQCADEISTDGELIESTHSRRIKVVVPVKKKCVLVGKTADGFGIVGSCDELAARLEGLAKGNYKMTYLGQCQKIVGLIPETKHWAICLIGGEYQSAYHVAFLAIGKILERESHAALLVRKLDDQASRIFADGGILDIPKIGHHLFEITVNLGIGGWGISQDP